VKLKQRERKKSAMIIKITGRHLELTESMRAYAQKKIGKLSKYSKRLSEIEVTIDSDGTNNKVEIISKVTNHASPFVVTSSNEDAYACVDMAVDKMERQLIKDKEKTGNHKSRTCTSEATSDAMESKQPAD